MTGRHSVRSIAGALVASVAIVCAACDANDSPRSSISLTAPSGLGGNIAPFIGLGFASDFVAFSAVRPFNCPLISPFTSNLSLFVNPRAADFFMERAQFRFLDAANVASLVDFRRRDLTQLFGSTFIAAGRSRRFDFSPRFGCGFASLPRSVIVQVDFVDRNGVMRDSTISTRLR